MSTTETENDRPAGARRRLTRQDRYRQLVDVAWSIVREEGTDALTLGHLAEQAKVAKPVVYDHFTTRPGLLAALYREFDTRHTEIMDATIATAEPSLESLAAVIASSYVDCVLTQGREIPGVIAALESSPELEKIKREYEGVFMEKCRRLLSPYAGQNGIRAAGLWAMIGAAEALSNGAANGDITTAEAKAELTDTIEAMVGRSLRG
jgi:AcrR family transcriptional regulator